MAPIAPHAPHQRVFFSSLFFSFLHFLSLVPSTRKVSEPRARLSAGRAAACDRDRRRRVPASAARDLARDYDRRKGAPRLLVAYGRTHLPKICAYFPGLLRSSRGGGADRAICQHLATASSRACQDAVYTHSRVGTSPSAPFSPPTPPPPRPCSCMSIVGGHGVNPLYEINVCNINFGVNRVARARESLWQFDTKQPDSVRGLC